MNAVSEIQIEELVSDANGRNRPKAYVYLMRTVEALGSLLVVGLIGLVLVSVFSRYVLSRPIFSSDELASLLFLWMIMLGSVVALDRGQHLRLTLLLTAVPPRARQLLETLGLVLIGTFLIALLPAAVEHVISEAQVQSIGLGISMAYRMASVPAGLVLMLVVLVTRLFIESRGRDIAIALAIQLFLLSVMWLAVPIFQQMGNANIVVLLIGVIAFCLAIGVPISFCFGLGALSFLVFSTHLPLTVILGRMDEGMAGLVLLSVPVFILLGSILDQTGMGKAIVDCLAALFGHFRAGMSYVMLGSLYLVSGISGSKFSDMATVAPALFPEMRKRGNKPEEMVALLSTGAIMADTVPPSILLIVVGSVAGVSISALFASGFVVALFLLIILAAAARWKARREDLSAIARTPFKSIGRLLIIAFPALLLPFLIRGAVTEGIATATEVSTFAVAYALIAGTTIYGRLRPGQIYSMLVETLAMTGAILIILGTASAVAWSLTQTGFARSLYDVMTALPGGWMVFMLVTVVMFLVLGCLLEGIPAIVLLAPMMFPIARSWGIDPVHYAMTVVVAMNIGMFLPPMGIGFYIACSIGKVEPDSAMRSVWFYLFALVIGLIALALIPALSIGLL